MDRNAFPRRRQKKVLGEMLKSEIVPYVYKNKVEPLDHSCRLTSMEMAFPGDSRVLQEHKGGPKR